MYLKTIRRARQTKYSNRLRQNRIDPTRDGYSFEVESVEAAFAEVKANGLKKEISEFDIEKNDDGSRKVFYVVTLMAGYWFGERQTA